MSVTMPKNSEADRLLRHNVLLMLFRRMYREALISEEEYRSLVAELQRDYKPQKTSV